MDRNIYLQNTPLDEAMDRWLALCRADGVVLPLPAETVPTAEALGRVAAKAVFARVSSPPFHSSAMDGVAVSAEKTYGASETSPLKLVLGKDVELIDTGEPVPLGFDAVIMVEDLNEIEPGVYEIIKPASPWQHVRPMGEDIVQTELVVPAGHRVRPVDIGALLNAGHSELSVHRRPVVAIVPTGTELVEDPALLEGGKIMESNSRVLAAFAHELGALVKRMDLIPDDRDLILKTVGEALDAADLVVVNAGTSAGREDFTRSIIDELGQVAVHGVAMRPGKPVVLGAARGKPVIGLPGFPVANFRGAQEFMEPMIAALSGAAPHAGPKMQARLARKIFSAPGMDEFVQVKVGKVNDVIVAVPLPRGSGVSMALVRSDGVVKVPAAVEGVSRWADVTVLLSERDMDVEGTILAIGSHDVSLDLLSTRIREEDPSLSLASANVGSMGGIIAIKEGQAHIAGTHLLDPETGDFNVPYILERLSPDEVLLVHLGWREQGLMVAPGNPAGIEGAADLARKDVRFVNRQKGSGTRLLLDYELGRLGVDPGEVTGYEREMFTHTAVAAAVKSGSADAGLGVLAAARALGLDFVPVARERYDLLVLGSFSVTRGFEALTSALKDPRYREQVEALGGYDLSESGKIIDLK
ncbi:MAG TPA: molybdopterin biosynthesis protein [Candidatus Anoxymicrobiaceae bacterium]